MTKIKRWEGRRIIELSARQLEIMRLVKQHAPIIGDQLAELLGVSRPTLRSDLSLLVMLGLLDAKPKVGYFLGNAYQQDNAALQRLRALTVQQVQGAPVSVPDTLSVHDAVVALFTEDADTLLVVNGQMRFAGIVTPKDLLKVTLGHANAAGIPVSMVMTRYPNIVTVSPSDPVTEAVRKMTAHQLDCLPVVVDADEGGVEVVGSVTKTNVVNLLKDIVTAAE
ncbi:CBS domain-containing protein [Paenibacillus sp. IB182496]|uniref:CBS domain-containing protein n=1 Tax=Paenibacillus sabuli TaxID=2772509 RepID=A0A927BPG9_9BACL|nr:CBS domain-containing protein [Paenibacillus sabuli]MBD2844333.1 CBS domain-containing protein [Paenibacillus sabuli]